MNAFDEYERFLQRKHIEAGRSGMAGSDIPSLNPSLFDWQADNVRWALRRGKAALFCDTGLGKTFQQLEWARCVCEHTGGNVLILAPLSVSYQTEREGQRFGIPVTVCKLQDDARPGINVTNYERLDKFDPSAFVGVVLDESSILKNYSGKTKTAIIEAFKETQWKLEATATPSPNNHMEILNHADFLDVMGSHEALAIWFINEDQAGKYRLKRHAEKSFWQWVSSWAVSLSKPSDLGYGDDGFDLPQLTIERHVVDTEPGEESQGMLFRIPNLNATGYHREKRISAPARAARCAELALQASGPCVIWCETNYEADAIRAILGDRCVEVRGNDKSDHKERTALDFADGKIPILLSKVSIFGYGMNFQSCHDIIFCGMSYSWESFYQAVRRCWRFGQTHEVNVNVVIGDGEDAILKTIDMKQDANDYLKSSMADAMRESHGIESEHKIRMVVDYKKQSGKDWEMIHGDSVVAMREIPDNSIPFCIHSPPFSTLYIYSDAEQDMGNSSGDEEFFEHYDFVIRELYRTTLPGRLCAVHCKDLVDYKGRDGRAGLRDFPGDIIRAFERRGWKYHSKTTIWADPVTEMHRTHAHGLLHCQLKKDSTFSRMGLPDYLVVFRKWAESEAEEDQVVPVSHSGEEYPVKLWQRVASPVWMDVNRMRVLNVESARDDKDEKHLCPLQLDVIERAVKLWSNPGEVVFSPFAGVGSEGVGAIAMGRKFLGIELKESYFERACLNLRNLTVQAGLFDDVEPDDSLSESSACG